MEADAKTAFDELRLAAAMHFLRLIGSWDVPPVADLALQRGLYTDAIAALAYLTNPTRRDVEPPVETALAELGDALPSRTDAAWYVANHFVRRIAESDDPPFVDLQVLQQLSDAVHDVLPNASYAGDSLDAAELVGLYWSYTCPNENWYKPENRHFESEWERLGVLDGMSRKAARDWLRRHPNVGFHGSSAQD